MVRRIWLSLLAAGSIASVAEAQTTGTPVFLAPYHAFRTSELGGYFTDPGEGFTLEGMYRYGRGSADLGFRVGIGSNDVKVNAGSRSTFFLAGVDIRQRVIRHTESFPLDGALTLGVGGNFGDINIGYIPVGLTLGRKVDLEGTRTTFTPYFHPVLVQTFGDGPDELLFAIGLGINIEFSPRFDARIGAGLGDYDGISLGIAFTR
jgi:hypothetical protein